MTAPGRKQRRAGPGLESRLREFFQANPDEELSLRDICAKFDCSESTAYSATCKLHTEGLLRRVAVYRRAPA